MFFDPVLTSCLPVPVCCVSLSLTLYLYNRTLWSVCLQPHSVVEWNIVLFSVMGVASLLQAILCASNVLNSLLGMIVGPGLCKNQVCKIVLFMCQDVFYFVLSGVDVNVCSFLKQENTQY